MWTHRESGGRRCWGTEGDLDNFEKKMPGHVADKELFLALLFLTKTKKTVDVTCNLDGEGGGREGRERNEQRKGERAVHQQPS